VVLYTAAGGNAKESDIQIEALTRADAEELRAYLGQARQHLRQDPVSPAESGEGSASVVAPDALSSEGDVIYQLSARSLLLAGATSGRIGPAAAIVGFGAQFADDLVPQSWWERLPWSDVAAVVSSVQAIFLVVLVLGVIAWLLSVISTVLSIGGFEMLRHNDQLLLRFGLLDRRRLTIPLKRIQAIRVVEGALRQPFGLAEIRFESAGYNTESGENGMLLPILRRSEVAAFLQEVAPDFAFDPAAAPLRKLPSRALRRYTMPGIIEMVLAATVVVAIAWRITDEIQRWSLALYLLVPLVAIYGWLEFRDAGWQLDRDRLLIRGRNGARETVITRRQRLQHRRVQANWFQRRAKLTTFRAAVASGGGGGGLGIAQIDEQDGEFLLAALASNSTTFQDGRTVVDSV
jgi:putative membrane protein